MPRIFRRFMPLLVSLSLVVGLISTSSARAQAAFDFKSIDALMARLMDMYQVPGAALALVKGDQVIYTQGYGFRNVEDKAPVTPDTVFAIGSVTKSFTALDVGQLVDQRKIDLDAPVINYLPDFRLTDAAATKALTVREVISHSSGLPRDDELWAVTPPSSRAQVISDMAKIPLTAKPGQLWQYCNQNFVLAGYLVENITGQTWEQYTQRHILDPLGMKSANFAIEDLQKAPHFALPYLPDVFKGYSAIPFSNEEYQGIKPMGPAGSINANLLDMAQYARFQLGDGSFDGKQVVSKTLLDQMHTRQIDVKGSAEGNALIALSLTNNIGYGFGWITEQYRGYDIVQHDGIIPGYTSSVMLIPSEKLGIVLLFNTNSNLFTDAVRLSVMENLLQLKPTQDIPQTINTRYHYDPDQYKKDVAAAKAYKPDLAALQKITGDYTGIGGNVSLALQDGVLHLLITVPIKQDVILVPLAPDTFLLNGTTGTAITIKPDANGVMTAYQEGTVVGQRLAKGAKATTYNDPKGRYSVTIPAGLTVQQKGDVALVQPAANPQATQQASATQAATQSAQPPNTDGLMTLQTKDAGSDDLPTSAANVVKQASPTFAGKPVNQRDVPISGVTWTQFIYVLPDNSLFVVEATRQGKVDFFMTIQGSQNTIQAQTGNLNAMLLSFKVTL